MDLHNEAEQSTPPDQEEEITGICCTYCIHSPVPAVRSCLLCEASLCDNHLRVHSKGAEHVLTEPSTNLENRKCPIHNEVLKYYCNWDAVCICASCRLAKEHQGHRVEMLDEASEKKKKKLRNVLYKLITKRKKTEERIQSLEEQRRKAQEKASGEAERVTALFIDIRRRVDDLEKRVLSEISRQETEVSLSSSALIQQLEIKKDELSRKMRHIEELCNVTDPLTVLQDPINSDLHYFKKDGVDDGTEGHDGDDEDTKGHDGGDEDTKGHDGGDEDTKGHDGGDEDTKGHDGGDEDTTGHDGGDVDTGGLDKTHGVDVDVITGMLDAGISDIITHLQIVSPTKPGKKRKHHNRNQSPQDLSVSGTSKKVDIDVMVEVEGVEEEEAAVGEKSIYGQGPADILLDVNTAHNKIFITEDKKTATWADIKQNCPITAERFQHYPQVMSSSRFSSGRHYWDVEIDGEGLWMVGMCYPSMARKGPQSYIGKNNKSWCLYGGPCPSEFSVRHDSKETSISSDRVRICLDYEAGELSFYELCDPIRHLYTFTATFTEPLHAILHVYNGCIRVLGGTGDEINSGIWEAYDLQDTAAGEVSPTPSIEYPPINEDL